MLDKFQITFKRKAVDGYPVVSGVLESLTGSSRTKTFISTCEAFARLEGMEDANPEALYHHAEEILKGFHPQYSRSEGAVIPSGIDRTADMTQPKQTKVTEARQNSELLNRINESINSLTKGGN